MVQGIGFLSFVYLFTRFQVAVFAAGVDTSATETKGTVLIHTAEQVLVEKEDSFWIAVILEKC